LASSLAILEIKPVGSVIQVFEEGLIGTLETISTKVSAE
jgi:hypothetical protein